MSDLKPSSKGMGPTYDPTSMEMKHDSVFKALVPSVANSGNLAHKWDPEGDHTCLSAPPSDLKGE